MTIFLIGFIGSGVPFFLVYTEYSLEEGIEVMSILITQMRCLSRFFTFFVYRNRISNLISKLYSNFHVHRESFDEEESQMIEETTAKCKIITKYYVGLFICTGVSMVMQPITAKDGDLEEGSNLTSESHRPLPFKSYYPKWDSNRSPQYETEYVAQSYLALIESLGIGSIDSFCVTILMYVSCQFDLLSISLRNLKKNVLLKIKNEKDINSSIDKNISNTSEEITTSLRCVSNTEDKIKIASTCDSGNSIIVETEITEYITKCIRHHQAMLRYCIFYYKVSFTIV